MAAAQGVANDCRRDSAYMGMSANVLFLNDSDAQGSKEGSQATKGGGDTATHTHTHSLITSGCVPRPDTADGGISDRT